MKMTAAAVLPLASSVSSFASTNNENSKVLPNGTPFCSQLMTNEQVLLSVTSYNLLAPLYVRPVDKRTGGIQPFAAFEWISENDSEHVLGMNTRGPRLLASLRSCQADVICLQELQLERNQDDEFELPSWIRPITKDYQLFLPPKEVLNHIAERNVRVLDTDAAVTCAILFRNDRWEAIDDNNIQNDDTNTCISICLKGKAGSSLEYIEPVVVTSLHLDASDESKRVSQVTRCLKRARTLQENKLISTIIAGDLNTECSPGSCVTAFLRDSQKTKVSEKDMQEQCASALRLESDQAPSEEQMQEWKRLYQESQQTVHDLCVTLGRVTTGTTRAGYDHSVKDSSQNIMGQWRLDHILYTPSTLQPFEHWSTLEDDPESCSIGLPNSRHGSDHMPIGALFRVQPRPQLTKENQKTILDLFQQIKKGHLNEIRDKENVLAKELASIEAQLPKEEEDNNDNDKKKGKKNKKTKGPPPKEVVDFVRKKRYILRELKERQKEERHALVKDLGDLERLVVAQEFGCFSVREWVLSG